MRLRAVLRLGSLFSCSSSPVTTSTSVRACHGWHSSSHFNSCSRTYTILRRPILEPSTTAPFWAGFGFHGKRAPFSPFLQVEQGRTYATKLKKTKIKSYSSYKSRFKLLANGKYKRWRSGKRHNAHSKTPKRRRQLRRPAVAPPALAKVMKKLNVQ